MHFERNRLFPVSLGFSPLIPAHPRDWHFTTGIGPPSGFRRTSPWPGLDRLASDCILVTVGAFTPHVTLLRATRFSLSLRFPGLNQLTSPLRYTPCPVFRNGHQNAVHYPSVFHLRIAPFTLWLTITIWFQALFTPFPRCFSTFRHRTSSLSDSRNV